MLSPQFTHASSGAWLGMLPQPPVVFTRERAPAIDGYLHHLLCRSRPSSAQPVCGRILRGSSETDFKHLSPDPNRRVVMLLGSQGMHDLIGLRLNDALKFIGYSESDIRQHSNKMFCIFVGQPGTNLKPATWDNLIEIAALMYPEVAAKLTRNLEALKTHELATLERLAGFSFSEVEMIGPEDPRYMTAERFAKSSGNPYEARLFLFCSLQCRELFAGDGFTRRPDGSIGTEEYVAPNKPLWQLGPHALISFPSCTFN